MREQIQKVLDEKVRPQLALHNGDLELLDIKAGTVYIRLLGQCSNCPASYLTTEELIYTELAAAIPDVKKVIADQSVSDDLLEQARQILRGRHGEE